MSTGNRSLKGKIVTGIVLIIVLMMTNVLTGCISSDTESKSENLEETEETDDQPEIDEEPDDGDGNESEPPEIVESEGTIGAEGTVETLAQSQPETVSETVELDIPEDNITRIEFVIRVQDGDDGTKADEVSGSLESTGGGGYYETLPQSYTPYTSTINIEAPEGQSLPNNWSIFLEVVCHASDDTWLGPLMWVGTPDYGFSYNINATYKYMD